MSEADLTLIRWDDHGWLGYDVYDGIRAIGHIRRHEEGREWAWAAPGWGHYVGFLPRRKDAVELLLELALATKEARGAE